MAYEIPDHFYLSFTRNVELLLQQRNSRFAPAVMQSSYGGKAAQVVKQFGEVEFQEVTTRNGDTNFSEIDHKQRWVFPTDYDLALPVDREDELRMLDSPVSPYAEAMRAAWARRMDATIVAAFFANAQVGVNGASTEAFDSNMEVGTNVGGTASGLNIEKLIAARELLMETEALQDGEEAFIGVSSKQLGNLLNEEKVTNSDYATIKALVRGDIDSYMGFKFIRYEGLPYESTNLRNCPVWVKSGMHLGQWGGFFTRIDQRPDKRYLTQVFMAGTIGATRTQEGKVAQIQCTET